MPISLYRQVQWYQSFLGDSQGGAPDYLGDFELFSLPIYASDIPQVKVE
jgi:hypothetical protein